MGTQGSVSHRVLKYFLRGLVLVTGSEQGMCAGTAAKTVGATGAVARRFCFRSLLTMVPVAATVFTDVPAHGPCTVPVTGTKPRQSCSSSRRETDLRGAASAAGVKQIPAFP